MGFGPFSISLSGINAGFKRLHVSGDNVARAQTPNAEKNRLNQMAREHGGVETQVQKIPLPEESKQPPEQEPISTNIDYAEEAINQSGATLTTKANMRVTDVINEMEQQILDIKA